MPRKNGLTKLLAERLERFFARYWMDSPDNRARRIDNERESSWTKLAAGVLRFFAKPDQKPLEDPICHSRLVCHSRKHLCLDRTSPRVAGGPPATLPSGGLYSYSFFRCLARMGKPGAVV